MKTAGIAAALALLGALASPCNAATGPQLINDGNTLLTACKSFLDIADGKPSDADNLLEMGQCIGIVGGVKTTMESLNGSLNETMKTCFPVTEIKVGPQVRTVVNYLNAHPETLALDSSVLTMLAFHTVYPCKK
ncbi:Rap1a/Tai family immunity protein [Pseudomonas sp. CCC3.1]|uniref:Rap1a/Tai family immunity protein n=1 Tax=Pseudomonas sp. CCC3.1 TaxID=3048607 RepID=UPI002AC8D29E|nr:Rap1a/Tai family immunity protein [Pseudomonas sp. CCC3.1]MEB0207890.1 Rap1a/Tai family immunity protein [Pseudomonas sp. CCC3.1]WPX35506.1 Rap1a/Tai family immunity protein [Pseudomonas sp. CCC3.1]